MFHPYLTERLGRARMEELQREAERIRLARAARPPQPVRRTMVRRLGARLGILVNGLWGIVGWSLRVRS
ncbi:MAG: hypothetical protein ACE5JP_04115 [Candidatus Bipolaricaulia bacterium]